MFDALRIATSGMQAAQLRLQASAQNIANVGSVGSLPNAVGAEQRREPYTPVTVTQSSVEGGSVRAELQKVEEPFVETYSPSSVFADRRGMVAAPNVDLAKEMTDVGAAEMSFKANAMVVRAAYQMFDSLLNAMDSRDDRKRLRYV